MKHPGFILVSIFFFIQLPFSEAQKTKTNQDLLWARHYLKIHIDNRYKVRHELEERIFFKNLRQHQFMTRVFIDRSIGKGWNGALGFAYFLQTSPENPDIEEYTTQTELRPIIEFGNRQIISEKINIDHRYWSEIRFFEQNNESIAFRNMRFRYRLELRYVIHPQIVFRILDEIHFNAGKKTGNSIFDQNRFGLGAQFYPIKNLGFELAYINWFQQQSNPENFFNRNILRFTVFLDIRIRKIPEN